MGQSLGVVRTKVLMEGGDDLTLKGWDMRMPVNDHQRMPTFTCKRGYVKRRLTLDLTVA